MLQTTTFWLVNIERADSVIWALVEAAGFPVNFYRGWLGFVLTAVVPVAVFTTFPAQTLLGRLEGWVAGVAVVAALLLFALSRAFWQFALRHCTGASS